MYIQYGFWRECYLLEFYDRLYDYRDYCDSKRDEYFCLIENLDEVKILIKSHTFLIEIIFRFYYIFRAAGAKNILKANRK